jgi:hypothetical protein
VVSSNLKSEKKYKKLNDLKGLKYRSDDIEAIRNVGYGCYAPHFSADKRKMI